MTQSLPEFVVLGEALTDFIQHSPNQWVSKAGGAGWNVSRVVARLGMPSAFAGAISQDDLGNELWDLSEKAGLDTRFLQRYAKPPLLAMVPETHPPRYFFVGADSADLYFDPAQLPENWMQAVKTVLFGGISLTREPLSSTLQQQLVALKDQGVRIACDPNYRKMSPISAEALLHVVGLSDIVKVSDEDLAGVFPHLGQQEALQLIHQQNPEMWLLYTRGAEGATLITPTGTAEREVFKVTVADTVGAGDASIGGLLYSLEYHPRYSIAEHLNFAAACAAVSCMHSGAYAPSVAEVQQLMATP